MKRTECAERWQVEAALDGRLAEDARAALEQHLRACACCRKEHDGLVELATSLRDLGAQVDDELAVRRLRQPTLERANALMLGAAPRGRGAGLFALAACAVIVALAVFLDLRGRDFVRVEPGAHAEWKRMHGGAVERVALSSGTLLLHVSRGPHDPKLVVSVPDGEVEDIGTVFRVSVRDGRTQEISVREGRVVFHRRGAQDLALVAGSTWTASEPKVQPPRPQATPAPEASAPPEPTPAAVQALERRRPAHHEATTAARAAAASEDALYLEIVSLLRAGHTHEARDQAVRYLREYPTGFRVVEVTRVANAVSPASP